MAGSNIKKSQSKKEENSLRHTTWNHQEKLTGFSRKSNKMKWTKTWKDKTLFMLIKQGLFKDFQTSSFCMEKLKEK